MADGMTDTPKHERCGPVIHGTTIAERLARHAHAGQVDKAGQPYACHLERVVASLLRRWPDASPDEVAAAWLHDVIEDTKWDGPTMVKAGVSPGAVVIVQELTRPAGSTSYLAWIQSLSALGSISAVRIKLADNDDNSDPDRVASIPQGPAMLRDRYIPARQFLENRLKAEGMSPPE